MRASALPARETLTLPGTALRENKASNFRRLKLDARTVLRSELNALPESAFDERLINALLDRPPVPTSTPVRSVVGPIGPSSPHRRPGKLSPIASEGSQESSVPATPPMTPSRSKGSAFAGAHDEDDDSSREMDEVPEEGDERRDGAGADGRRPWTRRSCITDAMLDLTLTPRASDA